MIDEPVAPTQSSVQTPTEGAPTGADVSPKTYRPILIRVIYNATGIIVKNLGITATAGLVVISTLGREFNLGKNTQVIVIYISIFIVLIAIMVYLWDRIHFARTFSITSDSTGLTLQKDKKIIKIAWKEVASFQKYEVVGDQEVIELPKELSDLDSLKEVIEKEAAQSITEHLVSRLEKQGKVTLGEIDVTDKGLSFKGEFIPWKDIVATNIDEEKVVRVIEWPSFKPRRIAPVSEIPNYYTLAFFVERFGHQPPDPEPIVPPPDPPPSTSTAGVIFISYRRSDSADVVGRIYDRLVKSFGKDSVFKDVDSIPLGQNFKEILDEKVGECKVLLAIIGDEWLDAKDTRGKSRLKDSNDFVRIEIESALKRKIPVIPLLVGGASMPSMKGLPVSLQELVYRNAIAIRPDPDFHRDMDRLIDSLRPYLQ